MGEETCPLPGWSPNETDKVVWQLLLTEEEQETVYKLPTFLLLGLLMVVGLPGNILVLLVYGFRFPASTTKSFIMAMAAFDLLNCAVGMPFEMIDVRYDVEFNMPVACKIIRFWISLSTCGSVTVLLAVSIDRFRRICRAFHKQMSVKQSRILIGALTLLSVLFALPALILYGRHTEIRYNLELHDCSIDDLYKSSTIAAVYQYILGATWFVSIVILVIMYGFIIYKIHLQKKRRERLSNQSYDSTIFTRLKKLSETYASDQSRSIPKPGIDNSLFPKSGQHSGTSGRLQPSEANVGQTVEHDDVSMEGRNSKLINRLFSRDVNPIFEDDEDNGEVNDAKFCDSDEENVSLPEVSCNVRLISSAKTSLNNYLAASQETELNNRSVSLIQDVTPEEAEIDQSGEDLTYRSRKCGHPIGRYRSCESEQLLRELSFITTALEREWTSQGDDIPDATGVSDRVFCCEMRRASSQCNLNCAGKDQAGDYAHKDHWLSADQHPGIIYDDANVNNKIHEECKPCTDKSSEENCAIQHLDMTQNNPSDRSNSVNTTWDCSDSHQMNNSLGEETNPHYRVCPKIQARPVRKSKSASIDTTLALMKKKKSSTREIKTSKVSLMMLMVTIGFVLSYLPHLGIQIFKSLSPSLVAELLCTSQAYFVVHHFLMRFFFINNAINPIIYSFYNTTFRDRCLQLLKSPKSLVHSSEHFISNIHSISQDNDTS